MISRLTTSSSEHSIEYYVEKLIFSDNFNSSVYLLKSTNIKYLIFGYNFNQTVDNLPNSITYLKFGYNFDQRVDNLPKSLKHIVFGNNFCKHVFTLPPVLSITFGDKFNKPVHNLPNTVRSIIFGQDFDQNIDILPTCIKSIVFGHKYNTAKNLICVKIKELFVQNNNINNINLYITRVNFSTKIWSEHQYSNFNVTLNLKKLIISAPLKFYCNKKTFDNVKRNFFKKIPYGTIVKKTITSLPVYVPCVKQNNKIQYSKKPYKLNKPCVKQYSKKPNKPCNKRRSK